MSHTPKLLYSVEDKSIVLGDSHEMMAILVEVLTQGCPVAAELWRGISDMCEIVAAMVEIAS